MKSLKCIGLVLLLAAGFVPMLAAQDPRILLEKAIYTEETMGNLNEAIGLYQRIAADANATRTTSALALFRLGMCYQKSANTEKAKESFSKLLSLYPEQQDLISNIPAPSPQFLGLKPVPWEDGEVLQLSAKSPGGLTLGTLTYEFEYAAEAGREAWNLHTIQNGGSLNASVQLDSATFIPIRSIVKEEGIGREFTAKYDAKQIEYSMSVNGASGTKSFSLTKITYDDLQLVLFLRCLPFQEGFQISIPFFDSGPNHRMFDTRIEVAAKERITVSAGTFDCYKIIVTRGSQSPSSTYWISSDAHAYIVKASEHRLWGGTVYRLINLELTSIGLR